MSIRTALWDGVLAAIKGLDPGQQPLNRYEGDWEEIGDTARYKVRAEHPNPDGTRTVYLVTVKADRTVDNNDAFWGPSSPIATVNEARRVVSGNHHFLITKGEGGFGGRKFVIRFSEGPNAGTDVETTKLMYQGVIPPFYRDTYPNNAEFVVDERGGAPRPYPAAP